MQPGTAYMRMSPSKVDRNHGHLMFTIAYFASWRSIDIFGKKDKLGTKNAPSSATDMRLMRR